MERVTQKHDIQTCGSFLAVFGLAGGVLAALFGGLLTAVTWLPGAAPHSWLHIVATTLHVSTIPLLALSAFCLDGLEAKSARRTAATSSTRR